MSEEILKKLEQFEDMLIVLVERENVRDWYSTDQFARQVGKAEFTVREWCRLGRVKAEKRKSGRGAHASWAISHEELLRIQRNGLLPVIGAHRAGTRRIDAHIPGGKQRNP
jgi:hypothetical protein